MCLGNTSQYVSSKMGPGSQLDILLDMKEGSIQYVVNEEPQGYAIKHENLKREDLFLTVGIADFGESVRIIKPSDAEKVTESAPLSKLRKSLHIQNSEFDEILRKLGNFLDRPQDDNFAIQQLILSNMIMNAQELLQIEQNCYSTTSLEIQHKIERNARSPQMPSVSFTTHDQMWKEILALHLADRKFSLDSNNLWAYLLAQKLGQYPVSTSLGHTSIEDQKIHQIIE